MMKVMQNKDAVNRSVVLKTFNRPELLKKCLHSLFECTGFRGHKLIVIHQTGNEEVAGILEDFKSEIHSLVQTRPSGSNVESCITNNTMLGFWLAFDFWQADYVLALEEDVQIGKDALEFAYQMFIKYRLDGRFRGVNLGSVLPRSLDRYSTYTRTRYGLHGPAGMITRSTWNDLDLQKLSGVSADNFDALMEFNLKSGFMVAPNNSRYLDRGFVGTHSTKLDQASSYFTGLESSFVSVDSTEMSYRENAEDPNWRRDCKIYSPSENWIYDLRSFLYPLLQSKLGKYYLKSRIAGKVRSQE